MAYPPTSQKYSSSNQAVNTSFLSESGRTTRIKLCGITRPQDAVAAAELGADAIGLVFYRQSPRAVTIQQSLEIVAELPPELTLTGLFVDASEDYIRRVVAALPLSLLQFHGSEPAAACARYGLPYLKAIRPDPRCPDSGNLEPYRAAFGILWDTYDGLVHGGSGRCGDWSGLPSLMSHQRNILAGGLTQDNVSLAISATSPYAVDVSSGIEERPGIKCHVRMRDFIKEVCNAS